MPWEKICLVLLDVDGVLTDGSLWIGPDGEVFKRFDVKDGLGIYLLQQQGIQVGIITGRCSRSLLFRAEELKISLVYQGISDKLAVYNQILQNLQLEDSQVAYMGDDLPDIPVLKKVGLSSAPLDAASEVKEFVHFISPFLGGRGAVRSLAEFILKSQGKWKVSN